MDDTKPPWMDEITQFLNSIRKTYGVSTSDILMSLCGLICFTLKRSEMTDDEAIEFFDDIKERYLEMSASVDEMEN